MVEAFRYYASAQDKPYPSREVFRENLTLKMDDTEFLGDIKALIREDINYDHQQAFDLVCKQLVNKI